MSKPILEFSCKVYENGYVLSVDDGTVVSDSEIRVAMEKLTLLLAKQGAFKERTA